MVVGGKRHHRFFGPRGAPQSSQPRRFPRESGSGGTNPGRAVESGHPSTIGGNPAPRTLRPALCAHGPGGRPQTNPDQLFLVGSRGGAPPSQSAIFSGGSPETNATEGFLRPPAGGPPAFTPDVPGRAPRGTNHIGNRGGPPHLGQPSSSEGLSPGQRRTPGGRSLSPTRPGWGRHPTPGLGAWARPRFKGRAGPPALEPRVVLGTRVRALGRGQRFFWGLPTKTGDLRPGDSRLGRVGGGENPRRGEGVRGEGRPGRARISGSGQQGHRHLKPRRKVARFQPPPVGREEGAASGAPGPGPGLAGHGPGAPLRGGGAGEAPQAWIRLRG